MAVGRFGLGEPVTDVGVEGLETIPVEIQEDVKQRVSEFFGENLDLTIDDNDQIGLTIVVDITSV